MNVLNTIQTKLIAPKGQFNSFGKYKYRSCEDILEALKPLLKETESVLLITDEIILVGDRHYVKATATLKTKDGEYVASAFAREALDKKGMDESQITGAASSYARKYALNGLFCIDDNKDADSTNGNGNGNTEYISKEEGNKILDLVAELKVDLGKFLAFMRIESLEKMPKTDYSRAISALEAKKAKEVKQ